MRLLLEDGFSTEKGTGVGRYTQNLAKELARCPEVEVLPQPPRGILSKIRPASARRIAYAAWLETSFQKQIRKLGPELVHFTNYLVPGSRRSKARYAVTIHDLTAWKLPEALPSMYGRYIRWAISRAVKFADLVLCPSDAIRNEVIEHFGIDNNVVRTAWNANSHLPELSYMSQKELSTQFPKKLRLERPFILFVGTMERRKNITTLVKAFASIAKTGDLQLLMVGKPGYGFSEIEASIDRQSCRERCIITGYVSDEELSLLYTLADLFVYPSRYEGFGIPLVEAMSFGVPIVASRIPASEEVAGNAALFYEDPMDDTALAARIIEVMSNSTLKNELSLRGKQRAVNFRWENTIQMYLKAYRLCLNGR